MEKILQVLKKIHVAIGRHPKRAIGVFLVFAIVFAEMGGFSVLLKDTLGAVVPGNVITNHPFTPTPPDGPSTVDVSGTWGQHISQIPWNITQNAGYDQAYTQDRSQQHNGTATTSHVVVTDGTVKLFGYGRDPYHNEASISGIGFETVETSLFTTRLNFHNFKETGLYFGNYRIVLRADRQEGSTASLYLTDASGNVLATYMTGIQNLSQQRIDIKLATVGGNVQIYINGALRGSVPSSGAGKFGFYASYFYHDCPELSIMQWDNVKLTRATYASAGGGGGTPSTSAKVNFVLVNTSTVLAPAHTQTGYVGQQYKVEIPSNVGDFIYVGNSRGNMNPIDPLTYNGNSSQNETTLYYLGPKVTVEYYVNNALRYSEPVPFADLALGTAYSHTAPAEYDKGGAYNGATLVSDTTQSYTPTNARPEGTIRFYYVQMGLTVRYYVNGSLNQTIPVLHGDLTLNEEHAHTAPVAIGRATLDSALEQTFTPTIGRPTGELNFYYTTKPAITKNARVWHAADGTIEDLDPGSSDEPVKVEVGDYIRYYLTLDVDKTYQQKWKLDGYTDVPRTLTLGTASWSTNTEKQLVGNSSGRYIDYSVSPYGSGDQVISTVNYYGAVSAVSSSQPLLLRPFTIYINSYTMQTLNVRVTARGATGISQGQQITSVSADAGATSVVVDGGFWAYPYWNYGASSYYIDVTITIIASNWRTVPGASVLGFQQPTLTFDYVSQVANYVPDPAGSVRNLIYDRIPAGLTLHNSPVGTHNSGKFGTESGMTALTSFQNRIGFDIAGNGGSGATNYFQMPTGDLTQGQKRYFFDVLVTDPSALHGGVFDNQAAAVLQHYPDQTGTGGPRATTVRSNHTYHSTEDPPPKPPEYTIREKYLDYISGTVLNPAITNKVTEGNSYDHAATATDAIDTFDPPYGYYGYSLDGGPVVKGAPPSATLWTNIDDDHEVTFYYVREPTITESYWQYDPASGGVTTNWVGKPDQTTTVGYEGDYNALSTYANNVPHDGYTYSYVGYDSGSGYTAGDPPEPLLTNVTADAEVKLYYRRDPVVTVEFRKWDDPTTANPFTPTKQTVSTNVARGDDYTLTSLYLNGFNASSTDWNYKGYSLGTSTTPVAGNPPGNPLFTDIQDDQRIILYFLDSPMVTTHFVEYGNPYNYLKDDHGTLMEKGDDFTLPAGALDPITPEGSDKVYTYVGYTLTSPTGTVSQVIQGPPPDPAIGNVQNNAEITLYYRTTYTITIKHHEHNTALPGDHVYTELLPVQTLDVNGGASYTGTAANAVPTPLFDGSNQFNKRDRYKWATDDDAENTGTPTIAAVWADQTIIYTYNRGAASTNHAIVQQWREYGVPSNYMRADQINSVAHNANFNLATLTTSYNISGSTYYYIGYEFDGGEPIFEARPATLWAVTENHLVRYLYAKAGVVEKFQEDGNPSNTLSPNTFTEVAPGAPYNSPTWINGSSFIKDEKTYNIVGYQIGGFPPVYGTIPSEIIANVIGLPGVTYLYREEVLEKKMHLRQVILDPVSGVPIHYTGYFDLENDGASKNVTTDSNVNGITVDYRDFLLEVSDTDSVYLINNILPQYYDYVGYVATKTEVAHDPSARVTTQAQVDFDESGEWWVTVYIKPRSAPTGQHEWDFITNDFGVLYPAP